MRSSITFILASLIAVFTLAQDVDEIFKNEIEIYFSFKANSIEEIVDLGRMVSVDDVDDDLMVHAYANRKGFEAFLEAGKQYTILQHPGTLHQPVMKADVDISKMGSWDFYPTYDAYVDMMYQFEAAYPDICNVYSIGTSNVGRDILVARISDNVGLFEGEPEFFYTSTMHGDETAGYVLMLRLIDYLLTNYGNNPRITNMVDEIDIYINPLANPDGAYYGGNDNIYGARRGNVWGVDLNRNFPDPQDGPHPDGNDWQKETMLFMDFAEDHNFVMSCNLHGGEEVCNYPWDTWYYGTADDDWWVHVCREYADTVHLYSPSYYMDGFDDGITLGSDWYSISGGRQDYMNYFHQCREFTLELSSTKLLPASQLPAHWEWNYRSLLNYMEQVLYGVKGKVTDSSDGSPLEAEVYILNHEEDSSWVYSHLPKGNYHRPVHAGTYDFRFSKTGYLPKVIQNVLVVNNEATILDVELVNITTVIEGEDDKMLTLYPNPVSGNLLKIKADQDIQKLWLYSLGGELVQYSEPNENALFVDVSGIAPGTYILRVEVDAKLIEQKLIRQ